MLSSSISKKCFKMILLSQILMLTIFGIASAKTISVCSSGCDFENISLAVANSSNGDIIEVKEGVYKEYIRIYNKSISIVGVGSVEIYPTDYVVVEVFSGKNITLKNLNIHGKAGVNCVMLQSSSDVLMEKINIDGCSTGIYIYLSNNTRVSNFKVESSEYGIEAYNSKLIHISGGEIKNIKYSGLILNLTSNSEIDNVSIAHSVVGIDIESSNQNTLSNLKIYSGSQENSYGIKIVGASGNVLSNSVIERFGTCLYLESSSENRIYKNTIKQCSTGVQTVYSSGNFIYLNSFLNNDISASAEGSKEFWNTSKGNLWSDFDEESEGCFDKNSDSICDNPYRIDRNNVDYMPIFRGAKEGAPSVGSGGGIGGASAERLKFSLQKYTTLSEDVVHKILESFGIEKEYFYDADLPLFAALAPISEKIDLYPAPLREGIKIRWINGSPYKILEEYVERAYYGAREVVVVRDDVEADAFSAIAYAKVKNAPVLLTNPKYLPKETKDIIMRLKPEKIIIVGGPEAVSEDVEKELKKYAEVERIWGETRIETSIKVAEALGNLEGIEVIVIQNGWHAKKSGAIVSYLYNAPIVYVKEDEVPESTRNYLSKFKGRDVSFIFSGLNENVINEIKRILS